MRSTRDHVRRVADRGAEQDPFAVYERARRSATEHDDPVLPLAEDGHARRGATVRRFTVAAAVVILGATSAAVIATRAVDDPMPAPIEQGPLVTDAPSPTVVPPLATVIAPHECGDHVPMPIAGPPGFRGPIEGPSALAAVPPTPEQLVVHWDAAGASIEVRWPPDAKWLRSMLEARPGGGPSTGSVGRYVAGAGEAHGYISTRTVDGVGGGACSYLQTSAYAVDDATASDLVISAYRAGSFMLPRVRETIEVDTLPKVVACQAPPSIRPPNRHGTFDDPTVFGDAVAALDAFLRTDPVAVTFPTTDYVELRSPDGARTFGAQDSVGYTVLITVLWVDNGWRTTDWAASGC